MIRCLVVFFLCLWSSLSGYGQSNAEKQILIRGRVVDSVGHEPIASATVSIYQKGNGKLLKYGFTNNRGNFNLTEIPLVDSVYQLRLSHIGYGTVEVDVNRPPTPTDIVMGDIQMASVSNLLAEVAVNRPPIMMDQDTLIINPEAFDLQPNAVVEDLLTKVPGVAIWGDGVITVNGKKVDRVLVEGKPFFGANPAIATRNLPSDAIDKVKVYDSPTNTPEREESLEMDIILKDGKKRGLFGKVSVAEGTKNHQEKTFLINLFDPKNQLSLFAGSNNTNKIAGNASDFLAANVYKAGGEDLEPNTPRFDQRGLNEFSIVGTKFEREWNDRIKTNLELLYNDRKSEALTDVHEIRQVGEGNVQEIVESRQDDRNDIKQSYRGTARYADSKWELRINSYMEQSKTSLGQLHNRHVTDQSGQSLADLYKDMHNDEQNRTGKVGFDLRQIDMLGPIKFNMSYEFEAENRTQDQQENILFSHDAPIDRLKRNRQGNQLHEMEAVVGLNGLLRPLGVRHIGVSLDLRNTLTARLLDEDQQDLFFNPATDGYTVENQAISYSDRLREIMWTPEIIASRGFVKRIGGGSNRWNFGAGLGVETTSRKNTSDHELRVLDKHTLYVLPSASARYRQTRQLSNRSLTLAYKTLVNQPQIHQLIALVDTTQKDFNQVGNRGLKPEEEYQFSLEYAGQHYAKNRNHRLKITYSLYRDQYANSSIYAPSGERLSQTVNTAGLSSFSAIYQYRRSKMLWGSPLNISLLSMLQGGSRYFFNNAVQHKSRRVTMSHRPEVDYALSDRFKLGLHGSLSTYWTASGLTNRTSHSASVGLDAVLTWPRRTTWISRFQSTHFSTKGLPAEQRYLWHMDVYYRLLKKEQLEIKFSAYDMLNNNRIIQNMLRDNTVRRVTVNNIQQFFMIGLSYYPRIF
ncbi:carboxypeptidase regulatory-like domain-containing protein [Parapedobacter sp. 10938]|uniref:carboxypeptidase regulatory-like domain-containing protein n=1 Tax=Parapedobacter flavus TaxID=3110225 RepID=UPI002DB93726|nr:carboxypeptidase regulatory-like domain-containing protein [Parapedobacter sp. 10938]MEC3880923.1 carboxypeptidase regulatory-like domain-containing protein [Parapedobacter sp. 10938]